MKTEVGRKVDTVIEVLVEEELTDVVDKHRCFAATMMCYNLHFRPPHNLGLVFRCVKVV